MKMKLTILTLLVGLTLPKISWSAGCFDHSVWDKILHGNVDKKGLIDLDGIRINKGGGNFYEYLTYVEIAELGKCSKPEKSAFWINAYNLLVIKLLLKNSEKAEIPRNDSMYDEKVDVANQRLSLNDILNRVLRSDPDHGGAKKGLSLSDFDPRLHFVLFDGTLGSPPLSLKAFLADGIGEQLHERAYQLVNNSQFIRFKNETVILPKIFILFKKDFEVLGGVKSFLIELLDKNVRQDAPDLVERLKVDYPNNVQYWDDRSVCIVQKNNAK